MKRLHRHLLTAGLLAGLGIAAVAQTQSPPPPAGGPGAPGMLQGERPMMDPARIQQRREQRMARRLDELKRILQITPQQEAAWTTWTTAVRPAQFQRPDRAEFARMTTPERIDRMKALRAQRGAEIDKRLDATKTFYAGLNVEQKRLFDAEGMRFIRGGKGGGHHGRHHRG